MRVCQKCGEQVPLKAEVGGKARNLQRRRLCLICSPFGSHNTRSYAPSRESKPRQLTCRSCDREYVYDPHNRKSHLLTLCNSCNCNRKRNATKARCVAYKGGKCQRCGYERCLRALSFHHRDTTQKEFTVAKKMSWSWERLTTELDKCDLLCANCHMEEHDELLNRPVAQVAEHSLDKGKVGASIAPGPTISQLIYASSLISNET